MSKQPMVEIAVWSNGPEGDKMIDLKIEYYRWIMLKSLVNSFRYSPDDAEWPDRSKEAK